MVTEPADPQIDYWADNLEDELVEAELDPPQAKAFARAFQLGMTRALSHCATKVDLAQLAEKVDSRLATKEELAMTRDNLRREIAQVRDDLRREIGLLRSEMRFYMLLNTGLLGAILAVVLTRL